MLTNQQVNSANLKRGRYADGCNLYLQVTASGGKSWLFRYSREGKEYSMGLGPTWEVSLAKARRLCIEPRRLLRAGIDPLSTRRKIRMDHVPPKFSKGQDFVAFTFYRYFDRNDDLIYVGRTVNFKKRDAAHAQGSYWYCEVERVELEEFSDQETLSAVERAAIRKEKPRENTCKIRAGSQDPSPEDFRLYEELSKKKVVPLCE